ncbi:hypothetical protein [Paracoccus litorisediminis]|uniref:ATP-dependent protease HslVU (ClpYQ), peptidase subunit n=1 Tax=Paracoccus litorisediminis TaxID=2006130 RepID=A0A844HMN5_9RHOB|nr:hypothetical protein [Paracoccus litorisediminis]MTH61180.1 hypothetical protein [Paracoccus litorisediminis]
MTTIVYRDGVLASDTRAYSGHATPIGTKRKIHRRRDGAMFGVSTAAPGLSEQVARWYLDDKNMDLLPQLGPEDGFDMLEIDKDGQVFIYHDSIHPTGPLTAPYFTVGSGANYAIGALEMGASAVEAVRVAITNDPWTGGHIETLTRPGECAAADKEETSCDSN